MSSLNRESSSYLRSSSQVEEEIRKIFHEHILVTKAFVEGSLDPLIQSVNAIQKAFTNGNKVLLFGNGGSAADAQHIAAEFVNRFMKSRAALPAVALSTDTSILTSVANDSGFNEVFARQIHALGRTGDVAWGLSTSGDSPNVVQGLQAAEESGLHTIGMTGCDGGKIREIVDIWIHVHHTRVPRIQELHITIGHIICQLVEQLLFCDPPTRLA